MEHRYDKRFATDRKTLIFKNGMPVALGRIHNFSCGGIFVQTEFETIDINQSLDIELSLRSAHRAAATLSDGRLCKALVMHKSNGGIGLLLREDCAETQRNFADFIAEELGHHYVSIDNVSSINHLTTPIERNSFSS